MGKNEIIVLKQLPIILYERLSEVGAEVKERIGELNLEKQVATEQTVKSMKELRADLNKEFAQFESQRKAIKESIQAPLKEFEERYKEFIAVHYNEADDTLKRKIYDFEQAIRDERENELREYFRELAESKKYHFIRFEQVGLNVTLSASMKGLREQINAFISKISEDIDIIGATSDAAEVKADILWEYQQTLDISGSIRKVRERNEAIRKAMEEAEEARKKAEAEAAERDKAEAEARKEQKAEVLGAPTVATPQPTQAAAAAQEQLAQPQAQEPTQAELYTMEFSVRGTIEQLRELKQFMIEKGIEIL